MSTKLLDCIMATGAKIFNMQPSSRDRNIGFMNDSFCIEYRRKLAIYDQALIKELEAIRAVSPSLPVELLNLNVEAKKYPEYKNYTPLLLAIKFKLPHLVSYLQSLNPELAFKKTKLNNPQEINYILGSDFISPFEYAISLKCNSEFELTLLYEVIEALLNNDHVVQQAQIQQELFTLTLNRNAISYAIMLLKKFPELWRNEENNKKFLVSCFNDTGADFKLSSLLFLLQENAYKDLTFKILEALLSEEMMPKKSKSRIIMTKLNELIAQMEVNPAFGNQALRICLQDLITNVSQNVSSKRVEGLIEVIGASESNLQALAAAIEVAEVPAADGAAVEVPVAAVAVEVPAADGAAVEVPAAAVAVEVPAADGAAVELPAAAEAAEEVPGADGAAVEAPVAEAAVEVPAADMEGDMIQEIERAELEVAKAITAAKEKAELSKREAMRMKAEAEAADAEAARSEAIRMTLENAKSKAIAANAVAEKTEADFNAAEAEVIRLQESAKIAHAQAFGVVAGVLAMRSEMAYAKVNFTAAEVEVIRLRACLEAAEAKLSQAASSVEVCRTVVLQKEVSLEEAQAVARQAELSVKAAQAIALQAQLNAKAAKGKAMEEKLNRIQAARAAGADAAAAGGGLLSGSKRKLDAQAPNGMEIAGEEEKAVLGRPTFEGGAANPNAKFRKD